MGRLAKLFGIGAIALATIGCAPEVKEIKDLTGDGILDALVNSNGVNYLFIGNKDGTYTRAAEKISDTSRWFHADNGDNYFFNGEFFQKAGEFKE